MKSTILIADDESDVRHLISAKLRTAGFDISEAADGALALSKARDERPALIILDIMMPELSGLDVCKLLKRDPETERIPIIMLTARVDEIDRILGMELGAEDYVTKPFSPRELVLRVQSILRRAQPVPQRRVQLEAGVIALDLERHQVEVEGAPVNLTAIEFKLLQTLMESVGRVQTRAHLLTQIWGFGHTVETRTIDTHVRRLRDKLGIAADTIQTVRSFGYRLSCLKK